MSEQKIEGEARQETFLDGVRALAQKCGLKFTDILSRDSTPAKCVGVLIQGEDGRTTSVHAHDGYYAILRSDGLDFSSPWYADHDPLAHVQKALQGFFAPRKSE